MDDLHIKWPHRWLTPKAKPGRSNIHRYGVFAKELIKKGEPINVFGGIAVPRSEIYEYRKIISHAGVQVSDDFFIVPSDNKELEEQGIFNHSCEPNVKIKQSFQKKCFVPSNAILSVALEKPDNRVKDFEIAQQLKA